MPRRVNVIPTSDFRGGIAYNADAFQLLPNEVSDALNVDFDPLGGFHRRDPVQRINATALGSTPANIWTFITDDAATKQIIVQQGSDAAYSTGGDFTAINPDGLTTSGVMFAATAGGKSYIQRNAENAAFTWNGSTTAVLTDSHGAYNDNFAAPVGGKMPKAKYVKLHRNQLFHANTVEAGTAKRSRLRFSHPASDLTTTKGWEDYRTNDWIDVQPNDGDEITAIVSWGERLVIFKNSSVWQLLGYDADSYQLENVSKTTGCVGGRAVCVGDEGVYFFSWPNGLQLFDGHKIVDLWYPMTPLTDRLGTGTLIDQCAFDANYTTNTALGWVNQRVWLSATCEGHTVNDITFVYDPRLGKNGGYSRYDVAVAAYTPFHPPSADRQWFGVYANGGSTGRVLQFHVNSLSNADTINTTGDTPIQSWCYTKWFDEGNPALQKRWKHPLFVVDADVSTVLAVEVYRDYDFTDPSRLFTLDVTANTTGMVWGTGTWGTGVWGGNVTGKQSIEKGGLVGRGTAVAFKIAGPSTGATPWGVNSVTPKYVAKRIRG